MTIMIYNDDVGGARHKNLPTCHRSYGQKSALLPILMSARLGRRGLVSVDAYKAVNDEGDAADNDIQALHFSLMANDTSNISTRFITAVPIRTCNKGRYKQNE